jgi:hypothetical protein
MYRTARLVSAALSAVITIGVLGGISLIAETHWASHPEVVARAKAREAAKAPIAVAAARADSSAR